MIQNSQFTCNMEGNKAKAIQDVIHKADHVVTPVAVTKTFPFEIVREAYGQGMRHFGENRIEEAEGKIHLARQNNLTDIVWHMIGHVQSRKIGKVVRLFHRIDSVDSIELLRKLNKEAERHGKQLHILFEINIAKEEGKYGFTKFTATMFQDVDMSHVAVDGFMTMAPYVTNPENNRMTYRALRALSRVIREQMPSIGPVLSMGTSCDWRVAIEEGATEIRLGEALFGKRMT